MDVAPAPHRTRLRRSQLDQPGIRRVRSGRGFRYAAPDGCSVDEDARARIQALVLPPAWEDVWICPYPNGHIQAFGTDAAGRRQYRYHDQWRARKDAEKFSRIVEFGRHLPELRASVTADLCLPGFPKDRVLALGTRLLDIGMFRIGGEEYAQEHETFGLATLEKRHVRIRAGIAEFDYLAKGGKRRQLAIAEPSVVELIGDLKRRRRAGPGLLAWNEGREWFDVSSHDLNAYLKAHIGEGFSAKDFRTWDATLLAAVLCAEANDSSASLAAKRRCAARIVRTVAESLGNTPAVCRKSYVDPRILDRFDDGETIASALEVLGRPVEIDNPGALATIEAAVVAMLDEC
jgi:DNA topoisomerase I